MEAIASNVLVGPSTGPPASNSFSDLASEDFLKLLITQLLTQDPLEPTGNEELLQQISSIREIELSTALTSSLGVLTGQQRFASASTLIGQYVTALPGPDGVAKAGIVVGVRFEADGRPMLQLADESEISLDQVSTIEPPIRAGEALIGLTVVGVDRRNPAEPAVVEGVVTAARIDEQDEVVLELDTGEDLRLRDFVSVTAADV